MRGKSLAILFIVALFIGVGILSVFTVGKGVIIYNEWKKYSASADIAFQVLEDPINQYDSLLGWKHIPGKKIDMEEAFPGEEIVFEINTNGFRGQEDYSREKPVGMLRIIAVGDSFTFGNVKVDETWPAYLERQDASLQVINMGASAYGIDQMYLWYREDGIAFDADIVICAVIEDDFWRALEHKWVSGHGRPRFRLKKGELTLTNVPVPNRVEPGKKNIHPNDFLEFLRQTKMAPEQNGNPELLMQMPFRVLLTFKELVETQGSHFVTVYLPLQHEFENPGHFPELLESYCQKNEIQYLNLVHDLRRIIGTENENIFRGDGHYNALGNRYVGEVVYQYFAPNLRHFGNGAAH